MPDIDTKGTGTPVITPPNNTPTKDTKQADQKRNEEKKIDLTKLEYTGEFTISGEPSMTNRSALWIDGYQPTYINGVWESTRVQHKFGDCPFETTVGCRSVTLPTGVSNLAQLIKAHKDTEVYHRPENGSQDVGESGAPHQVDRSIIRNANLSGQLVEVIDRDYE